jgi:hypothetical protein
MGTVCRNAARWIERMGERGIQARKGYPYYLQHVHSSRNKIRKSWWSGKGWSNMLPALLNNPKYVNRDSSLQRPALFEGSSQC